MKYLLSIILLAVFFVNPVKAADPSLPYFITDIQANAPGFVKPVSPFDTYPHKLTVESLERVINSSTMTSQSIQLTQPDLDSCIAAMKRIVAPANNFGNIGSTNVETTRRAYCSPAMQGAE
jgi:hypothetical protein